MAIFREVPSRVNFPELEARVLARWKENDVFGRSLDRDAPQWTFYEGPPTANAKPGVHHVLPRTFKDVYPRYKTMRGFRVPRKGGWDCHGLPVELEIEKKLGLSSKKEIEDYGIEAFNRQCRSSVLATVDDFARLTERIAFWVDLPDAYTTMSNTYIESVWWSLKQIYDQGLLVEDYKVTPYCPRCGTPLSDHEVAQGYETVTDPSVFVRFPLIDEPNTSLLVWTTTPWTLISNVAAAVHPEVSYVAVQHGEERLILAEPLVHRVLGEDAKIVYHYDSGALEGLHYAPPYRFAETDKDAWYVVSAEFVTTDDGTGIVHMAPAYGAEDLEVARAFDLPVIQNIDESGRFFDRVTPFAGMPAKPSDPKIIEDLRERGILLRDETIEHTYPLCWRCGTPLLYFARTSWYVRTTERKQRMLDENEKINWYPDHIKHGRFGDWLANNIDWSLSRNRYWGTPLPIWRCSSGHVTCVGSVEELSKLSGRDCTDLDLHRPYVDDVKFPCGNCGSESVRVKEVIDAWYDSGSMPFAQWHYPFENKDKFEQSFPADFIAEAIDQTRGWFYSLLANATILFGRSSYKTVICHGHIVDKEGRKMSKSLGNVIDPYTILDAQGADALRWYLLTVGSPWQSRRVYVEAVEEVVRGFLRMLWNVYSFYVLYANSESIDPATISSEPSTRPEMDRWILAELHHTIRSVTDGMEAFDCTGAGRRIAEFVDDLSNWYVRRAKRRFFAREVSDHDKRAAHATLYECLTTLVRLIAPFIPFVADELWENLVSNDVDSVHLATWPSFDASLIDDDLRARMSAARRVVRLGLQAREQAKIKVRQPLAAVSVSGASVSGSLADIVAEELNVKEIRAGNGTAGSVTVSEGETTIALDVTLTPELRAEGNGRELVRGIQNLRKSSGLAVTDRINLWIDCPDELWTQIEPQSKWIGSEVLATSIAHGVASSDVKSAEVKLDGGKATIALIRSP